MRTHPLLAVSLTAALLTFSAGAAGAAPLVFNNISAAEAAARLSAGYSVDIVLKANAARHVNVAVDDAADAGSRLQTVNALANALHLDFTKTIVVSKGVGGDGPAAVDSESAIPFGRTTLPAREAITLIAGVDDAFAKIAGDVGGTVTLSSPTLTVSQAEREIAKQTGTTWRAVYVLAPRDLVSSADSPLLVFPDRQREALRQREAEEDERQAVQQQTAATQAYQQALAQRQAFLQTANRSGAMDVQGMNTQGMNTQGYYANGSGSYGSPYQNGQYGNPYAPAYANSGYANGGYASDPYNSGSGANSGGSAGGNFPSYVIGGGM